MVEIWLPYGASEIPARIPEERLIDILRPNKATHTLDPIAEARRLIESNQHIQELGRVAQRICIVLDAFARKEIAVDLTKMLFESLGKDPQTNRTLLLTPDAAEFQPDPTIFGNAKILRHLPASSPTAPVSGYNGHLPVELDSEFVNADLRIVIGEVKPHHFFKYSGVPEAVFPGLTSETCLLAHLASRPNLTLPDIRKERIEIANSVKNTFGLALALDADLNPAHVTLGTMSDCVTNLESSVDKVFLDELTKPADIVVMSAGGAPWDATLSRAVETFPAGLAALKRNGVLIIAAECGKGHGETEFYDWSAERKEPRHLEARLRHRFNYNGFKASFLGRILQTHRVYLVSTIPDYYIENIFGLKAAHTVNAALQTAQRTQGSDSTITVIPDATRVIPTLREPETSNLN